MIECKILINGYPVFWKQAVRQVEKFPGRDALYKTGDGFFIRHNPDDGAIELAKKLMDSWENFRDERNRCIT